jgi:metallo-beta-lactamase family protein
MHLKFLGAAGTVTGSSYVLTSASGQSLLIDLGSFLGLPAEELLNFQPFAFPASDLIGALLTHAHLDHCGRLPVLTKLGFNAPVYMTASTRDLTEISLFDSAKIAKYTGNESLYDAKKVSDIISKFKIINYREPFALGPFAICYYDAGHILGSAFIEITDSASGQKIIFSGDLGNSPEPLLPDTDFPPASDTVVMESTYGDRLHPQLNPAEVLKSEITAIKKSGGTLLIPAFSLDRTQELLHFFHQLNPGIPVILDGPMAEKATAVYLRYPQYFNQPLQSELKSGNPFPYELLKDQSGPKIIIAGSGMMTGGRILNHALRSLPIADNRLLFVGYQGEGTLGREILEGARRVDINGKHVVIKATVTNLASLSAHADQSQLISWLTQIQGVKKVILTHGEDSARTALSAKITSDLNISDIILPTLNQEQPL